MNQKIEKKVLMPEFKSVKKIKDLATDGYCRINTSTSFGPYTKSTGGTGGGGGYKR